MFEDRKWLPIVLISPVNALLALLIAVPSVYIIWLSLNQSTFGSETTFVGLANYARIFADPIFWRSTINTFIVVNVVVYTELALALLLALALNTDFVGKGLVFSILIAPYAVTEVSAVVRVTSVHTGRPLLTRRFKASYEESFSNVGRGLQFLGIFRIIDVTQRVIARV